MKNDTMIYHSGTHRLSIFKFCITIFHFPDRTGDF